MQPFDPPVHSFNAGDAMVVNSIVDAEPCGEETELLTLGVERAAVMLSDLAGADIGLTIAGAHIGRTLTGGERFAGLRSPEAIISQGFGGQMPGHAMLCFSAAGGIALAQRLSGRYGADHAELDSELSGILLEVGNIVLNGILESLASVWAVELSYSWPELQTANRKGGRLDVNCADDSLIGEIVFRIAGQEIGRATVVIFPIDGIRGLRPHP